MPLTDDIQVRRRESPRADASERRRREILAAAADAFAAGGYNATSLRDIATRAGISHTGLLHHFPDKTALLEAVLDDSMTQAARRFPFTSDDAETFLRALVRATEHDVTDPSFIRLWAVLTAEAIAPAHPAHGYFTRWYDSVRSRLAVALEDLRAQGRYRGGSVPPAEAAAQILTLRDGANLHWLLDPDGVDLVGIVTAQTRMFANIDL